MTTLIYEKVSYKARKKAKKQLYKEYDLCYYNYVSVVVCL